MPDKPVPLVVQTSGTYFSDLQKLSTEYVKSHSNVEITFNKRLPSHIAMQRIAGIDGRLSSSPDIWFTSTDKYSIRLYVMRDRAEAKLAHISFQNDDQLVQTSQKPTHDTCTDTYCTFERQPLVFLVRKSKLSAISSILRSQHPLTNLPEEVYWSAPSLTTSGGGDSVASYFVYEKNSSATINNRKFLSELARHGYIASNLDSGPITNEFSTKNTVFDGTNHHAVDFIIVHNRYAQSVLEQKPNDFEVITPAVAYMEIPAALVLKSSQHQDEAKEFLKFLAQNFRLKKSLNVTGTIPDDANSTSQEDTVEQIKAEWKKIYRLPPEKSGSNEPVTIMWSAISTPQPPVPNKKGFDFTSLVGPIAFVVFLVVVILLAIYIYRKNNGVRL